MRKTMKISGLLWALLFAVGGADAAGLGRLSVQSALGQPLRAEIELLSVNKDELPAITARLAGAEAFRQARIDRVETLGALRFSVDQRSNGQPIIRVSSSLPIADPFLDMLIEVNWSSGRVLREYTILLDPPAEAKAAPTQPVAPPEAARPAQPQAAAVPVSESRPVAEAAKPKAPEPTPARQHRRYGPVKSGETLRGIAGKVRQDSVTLEQMMVGLYQANRDAFYAGNMNRMKRGQVLNVPEAEAVHLLTSPSQAARTIQGHAADWHAYRRKVAEMAGEAPAAKAPEPAAGKLAPKAEEKAPPAAAAPKDVLRLSKGEPGSAGRPDGKVQEKLHGLEEELAAKGRALQEAQDRIGQLERTVRDMEKLLKLKSQEVAKAPIPPLPAPAPVQAPAATPATVPVAPPPPVATAKPASAPKPAPAPVVLPVPVQQSSSSWLSTFVSNPLYIGGIVAAMLLSVLLWMMMVGSRRKEGLNRFEDSIMTGGEFKNNPVFGTTSAASAGVAGAPTEGSMLLTDFSRLGLGAIDTHEVDPIAEAEVYMAYGRDAQAEEILKEALNKDPNRHEIALKLLEIYAARKDTLAFETVASELYAGMGGQGTPVWQRAAEMGRSIDPSNPLYRATATATAAAATQSFGARPISRPATATAAPEMRAQPPSDLDRIDDWEQPSVAPVGHGSGLEFAADFATPVPTDSDFDIQPVPQPAAQRYAPFQETPAQKPHTASPPADEEFALEFAPASSEMAQPASTTEDFSDEWNRGATPAVAVTPSPAAWSADIEATPEVTAAAVVMAQPDATASIVESVMATEPQAWQEPEEADLEFDVAPSPEGATEVPVLDLSGIDLELEAVPASEVMSELAGEGGEAQAMPAVETITPPESPARSETAAPMLEPAAAPVPQPAAVPAEITDPELREEVNTKLDLARAYLEMGDKEGAREILQEVLGEGDAQQKVDADKLLAEAG